MLKRILKSTIFQFILVFVFIALAFYFYQSHSLLNYYPDEDSFYHVKIAQIMSEHGWIIKKLPYLYFSSFRENFIDVYFLYHLSLIPFIKIFGEPIGPKILNIIIVGGIFSIIFLIFKEKKLKYAFLFAILLFFLMPAEFYLRMTYIRGAVLALFFIVLSLYWLIKNRPIYLGITFFFFVWSYHLIPFIIFISIIAYLITQIFRGEKLNYKLLIWSFIGLIAGFILNPYFPKNISFLLMEIKVMYSYNFGQMYTPGELAPMNSWNWLYGSMMAITIFLGGIVISFSKNIKQSVSTIAILIFTLCMLVLQWKSGRFIEYWPVLGGMTGIILAGPYLESILFNIKKNWRRLESWLVFLLIGVLVYMGIFHGIWEYWKFKSYINAKQNDFETLKNASDYLKDNSDFGDIVLNYWDRFAPFFYFDNKNYYITGLDPMNLQIYDKNLFDNYIDIYHYGASNTNLITIKDDLKAKWILVDPRFDQLITKLKEEKNLFEKVFENKKYIIFKVK